jgi:hypothetical protein
MKIWDYLRRLVGNGPAATIGIFIFIAILCFLFWRPAAAADVDFSAGTSFGTPGSGPVLGLDLHQDIGKGLNVFVGTEMWGSTLYNGTKVLSNWDWHAGVESCRWRLCGRIGADYVQRVDSINGAHTNFNLGLSYRFTDRFSVGVVHISDAGTSDPNIGRQALLLNYRLQ